MHVPSLTGSQVTMTHGVNISHAAMTSSSLTNDD